MSRITDEIFKMIVEPFLRPRIKRGSIKAIKGYVTGVKFARFAAMGLFGLGVYSALFVVGFFLLVFGAVGLLPIEAETVAWTALIVGAVLFIASSIGAIIAFSQRRWLTMSKSYEMMDAVLSPWPTMMPPNPKAVVRGLGPKGELDFATKRVELEHALEKPQPAMSSYASPDVPLTIPPVDTPPPIVPQMMH
ncbi:MAG: phage holin family protein [Bdellovibrionota bacterium]